MTLGLTMKHTTEPSSMMENQFFFLRLSLLVEVIFAQNMNENVQSLLDR